MQSLHAFILLADAAAEPVKKSSTSPFSWIVDALAYGTFGVAAIILYFAFKLYSDAQKLSGESMVTAQAGAGRYMNMALCLTIPCVILQILGLILDARKSGAEQPPAGKVKALIHVPPLTPDVADKYGLARITVGKEKRDVKISETPEEIELNAGDVITVSVRGMTEAMNTLKENQKPKAVELRASSLK